MTWQNAVETLEGAASACIQCGACIPRCEVLESAEGAGCARSVGEIARLFADAAAAPTEEAARAAVAALAEGRPALVFAVRRCCMDALCTAPCPTAVDARPVFAALRALLHDAGVTTMDGFTMTQVDREWHIFSAYRAVHGIWYNDLPSLDTAREQGCDTLFFPGCTLASYAPALTREVLRWLQDQGMAAALCAECCGSPLRSGGLADRADAHRARLVARAVEAGIRRVVLVCPGCRDEWEAVPGAEALELVALPRLLAEGGARPRPEKIAAAFGRAAGEGAEEAPAASPAGTLPFPSDGAAGEGRGAPVLALMDSCHDRDGRFGGPLRRLFADCPMVELAHHGAEAACCGAAGAVSLVDGPLCERRALRMLRDEPRAAGADLVVANCPTCAYTFASTARARGGAPATGGGDGPPAALQYQVRRLEAAFDRPATFAQLEAMWTGEYGPWLIQELL